MSSFVNQYIHNSVKRLSTEQLKLNVAKYLKGLTDLKNIHDKVKNGDEDFAYMITVLMTGNIKIGYACELVLNSRNVQIKESESIIYVIKQIQKLRKKQGLLPLRI